jgi:hypothetical protein
MGTRKQRDLFKERVDEIRPLERYCRFELGDETDVIGLLMESQVRAGVAVASVSRCVRACQGNLSRGGGCTQAVCVHILKGLALPRVSHSGEIALSGSRCLCSTLAAAPVLFAHAVVTAAKTSTFAIPRSHSRVSPAIVLFAQLRGNSAPARPDSPHVTRICMSRVQTRCCKINLKPR